MANVAPKLQIALIHNNDDRRNTRLIPALEALCNAHDATLRMVGWQPPLPNHTLPMLLLRDWRYFCLELAWSRYRRFGLRQALSITRRFALQTLTKQCDPAHRARMRRISQVERLVTAKHVAAWQGFLETDATHLLCCEDDLVIKPDSATRLGALLCGPDLSAELRYIDLAGGLSVAGLGLDRIVARRDDEVTFYTRATTNTACCYLLSRQLAALFMGQLVDNPQLRLFGVDWMLNALMIRLHAASIRCDALHFDPPVFGHGSFTGEYVSWMETSLL